MAATHPEPLALLERISALEAQVAALRAAEHERANRVVIVAFSGELDPLLAAMNIATGSAAMGMEVDVFFGFWAVGLLRDGGVRRARLSRYDLFGLGRALLRRRMRRLGQPGLPELVGMARQLGVRFAVCEASLGMFGLRLEDLTAYPGLSACGVSAFMELAARSQTTLFI